MANSTEWASDMDYYEHPVFNPIALHVETPAYKQLYSDLLQWLWTGATGGYVYGQARVGKSRAIQSLFGRLHTRGNIPVPTHQLTVSLRDRPTVVSIFRQLCQSADLKLTNRDVADTLSDRFTHFLADQASQTGSRRVVLFVDEMQRLKIDQLNAFAELYDKLTLIGIGLTVVFIGNDPECWKLIEATSSDRNAHLYGRFFTQGRPFLGLTSESQVRGILTQYDTLRFPEETGPTYTAFFLPDDVGKGWTFASVSHELWEGFAEYRRQYKIQSWGMQYFTTTVNTLLTDYLPKFGIDRLDEDMIHQCIHVSGLIPSLVRPAR